MEFTQDHVNRSTSGVGIAIARVMRERPTLTLGVGVLIDSALIWIAFWLAYVVRYDLEVGRQIFPWDDLPFSAFYGRAALFVALCLVSFSFRGVYRLPRKASILDESISVAGGVTVAMGGVILLNYLSQFSPSRLVFVYAWWIAIVLLIAIRLVRHAALHALWSRSIGVDRVLVVGAGEIGRRVCQAIMAAPSSGLRIAGVAGDDMPDRPLSIGTERGIATAQWLGRIDRLPDILKRYDVDQVIVALPASDYDRVSTVGEMCVAARVPLKVVPDPLQLSMDRPELTEIAGMPMLDSRTPAITGVDASVKRGFDFVFSGLALVILFLPTAVVIAGRRLLDQPIEFRRTEFIGRNGLPSHRWVGGELDGQAHVHSLAGRLVSLYLNLFDVFRGRLSFVGPLPQSRESVDQYESWQRPRLMTTPGLTGLWRVSARDDMTFDEMVFLDFFYAEHWSVWLDLKTLLRTIPVMWLESYRQPEPALLASGTSGDASS